MYICLCFFIGTICNSTTTTTFALGFFSSKDGDTHPWNIQIHMGFLNHPLMAGMSFTGSLF